MSAAKSTPRKKTARKSARKAAESVSYGGISNDAVLKATGRSWDEWCGVIDKRGGAKMTHKEIAEMLSDELKVKLWWSQMVTVGYEHARGRRVKHEKTSGFEVSANKTMPVSASVAYMWWAIGKCRDQWLGDVDISIHKKTPGKSLRVTWNASGPKPVKSISVGLHPKGRDKTIMSIQHGKLASAAEAKKMKSHWGERLKRLERLIAERGDGE